MTLTKRKLPLPYQFRKEMSESNNRVILYLIKQCTGNEVETRVNHKQLSQRKTEYLHNEGSTTAMFVAYISSYKGCSQRIF